MFGISKQKLITDEVLINQALERRLENNGVFPNKEEAIKLLKSKPLKVYLGIDPTGPDIHLGHSIPLLFLRQLYDLGHIPVIVIGDFTARIGDPTDKDSARKPLTTEQIKENFKNYLDQIYKILPKGSFEVRYNSDWLDKLSFKDVVQLAGHVTVQQMIQRDMFQERLKNEKPIGLHEFLYPLMQGYDSVAMEIDGEVGGNDQVFNMLVGRDLEKKLIKKDKLVFATRLLINSDSGKKMSKSEGELISLSDSPQEMRRKVLMVDDSMVETMFKLCTKKPQDWIEENKNNSPRELKEELSDAIVDMYHGEDGVIESRQAIPSATYGVNTSIVEWATKELSRSKSEIKNLLDQGAFEINGQIVKDWNYKIKYGDRIIVGKGKIFEIG
ncbi:MAG: Tyrosine-tRNA ligase [Candidatus Yanofskybacteria bacterium GW2011_GWA1_41_6]|uniref:Tyrosine--tRNA ligase n=1 Tax=Candidatus Yanofskybacteria bacterium GW2011_GWA1_41_6 TaxID=1619020 RepID=A0A0G0YTZ0_9BACT|nr:MAG: Tyrosine-tRNA ligase [Candidatus Yanofskybacteria bacterium GW2011_GWA1_41_6]